MADTSALITLHQVVKELQHLTRKGDRDYYRILGLVGRGLTKINLLHDPKLVAIDETNLSDLTDGVYSYPSSALKIVDVFYAEHGKLVPIVRRRDIVRKTSGGTVSSVAEIVDKYGGKFHIPGGRCKYYYKDEVKDRRLIFDATADEDIWVYYVSTGIDQDNGEETLIPVLYQDYLEYWVLHKLMALEGNMNRATYYERLATDQAKIIKYSRLPSLNEIKDAIYETTHQGVKR